MRTPYELLLRKVHHNAHIRVFACEAFVHRDKVNKTNKIDDQSKEGVYIAIRGGLDKLLFLGTARVITSRHATLDELTYSLSYSKSKTVRFQEDVLHWNDGNIEKIKKGTANEQSVTNGLPTVHKEEVYSDSAPTTS